MPCTNELAQLPTPMMATRTLSCWWRPAPLLEACGLGTEEAGHDFWLTRNRHGSGFWDEDIGDVGRQLTEAACACGECNLYVGDDQRIYGL